MVSDEEQIIKKLDVYLEEAWLKYLLQLLKVDGTSAFFINKNILNGDKMRVKMNVCDFPAVIICDQYEQYLHLRYI